MWFHTSPQWLSSLCVSDFSNLIQLLYYYAVYIMCHYSIDVLFFIFNILSYNTISRNSVDFEADEEMQMNLLIFMHSLKLLSQPPLHHFLLVIWKLPRNRFADFLFIYSHYVNPLSYSSDRRLQNKKAKLPFTEKCESVIFWNWIISWEIRQWGRMLCLWKALFSYSFSPCLDYFPLGYNKLTIKYDKGSQWDLW